MQGSRFHRRILVLGAVVAGLSFYACAEQDPVSPEVEVNFAKGGGGPSVDAAQPSNAPQNITLDVQVIGSRFDNGSVAKWLLAGQSTPKVVVNSSTFIDRNTLVANITIEADADIALYDIEVTTSRGKKGIGSEIFSVRSGDEPAEVVWDGTQNIVYRQGSRNGVDQIMVVNDDGSNRAVAWSNPSGLQLTGAKYSLTGDGNAIIFGVGDSIYRLRRDPTTGTVLPLEPVVALEVPSGGNPAVSPNGLRIAYEDFDAVFLANMQAAIDIFVHDLATGTTVRVTRNNVADGLAPDSVTAKAPAWASDTSIMISEWDISNGGGPDRITVYDVGDLADADGDGVVDIVTPRWRTDAGSKNLWAETGWAPDGDRAIVTVSNPWDIWLVDFGVSPVTWCNLTGDFAEVARRGSLGPGGRLVFRSGTGFNGHEKTILTGSIGTACPTSLTVDALPLAVTTGKKKGRSSPDSPSWRR